MQTVIENKLVSYEIINSQTKNTCVVLHGWGHKGELWRGIASKLSNNYKYVLLDLPGFGGSGFLDNGADVPEYSQFIEKFIKKMGWSKVVIIGHSFGGQIGADLAIKEPKLVEKLVLVAPAIIRKKGLKVRAKIWLFSKFGILKKIIPKGILRKIYGLVSTADYMEAGSQHREVLKKIVNYDLSDQLHKIKCKVLNIWGDRDESIPYAGKEITKNIKDCQLRVIYKSGHNIHLSKPEELAQIINRFLK